MIFVSKLKPEQTFTIPVMPEVLIILLSFIDFLGEIGNLRKDLFGSS